MMARPFSDLPKIFKRLGRNIANATTELAKEAALSADRRAILATPVDTGLARSNWIATLQRPSNRIIPPYAPGNKKGIGERSNARGAQNQAQGVIKSFTASRRPASIFITNNVFYIGFLDRGGPTISPHLMASQARMAGVNTVRKRVRPIFKRELNRGN